MQTPVGGLVWATYSIWFRKVHEKIVVLVNKKPVSVINCCLESEANSEMSKTCILSNIYRGVLHDVHFLNYGPILSKIETKAGCYLGLDYSGSHNNAVKQQI